MCGALVGTLTSGILESPLTSMLMHSLLPPPRRWAAAACLARRGFASPARPFRVLGLQQVAIGGLHKGPLTALWEGLLGVEKTGSYCSESENVDEDILLLGKGPWAVELDLMQPLDPHRAPKVHTPALNHIGVWVDDLAVAVDHLQSQGVRFAPGGIRRGASGHDVAFIHPKGNAEQPIGGSGVLVELVQAPARLIALADATP